MSAAESTSAFRGPGTISIETLLVCRFDELFSRVRTRRLLALPALLLATSAAVTGCTSAEGLEQQWGDGKGYISAEQLVTEIAPEDRDEPIEFDSELSDGSKITAADYQGKVAVINFWYATCVPCRMEATNLQAVSEQVADDATFLGVNVRDQPDTADAFTQEFDVTYPTAIDVNTGSVQLAFAGKTAPNATPATFVLDPEGRVSARVLGAVDPSILRALVKTAAATPE
ncbi:TlpA disulfide reductase family protein [Frigoribacterium sp. PvP032]|uniref:TlpA family protein disulfide reductase n=1 Tax=Frigoribacterium sp. PvP032 TaxID=2806589 RepID=UPI001AE4ECB2|nr:TlpA disulfide reductase family protein [Frigoribacterium sp. PvP032]MBP1190897.1 peroxiredoxin [Frigoribacterium sp. PvP032]